MFSKKVYYFYLVLVVYLLFWIAGHFIFVNSDLWFRARQHIMVSDIVKVEVGGVYDVGVSFIPPMMFSVGGNTGWVRSRVYVIGEYGNVHFKTEFERTSGKWKLVKIEKVK